MRPARGRAIALNTRGLDDDARAERGDRAGAPAPRPSCRVHRPRRLRRRSAPGCAAVSPPVAADVHIALRDGSTARVRPVSPRMRPRCATFLGGLSRELALAAVLLARGQPRQGRRAGRAGDRPEGYGLIVTTGAEERVVAHAVFELERPDRAEVAFAVADEMQGRGLATVLLAHLAQVAVRARRRDLHRDRPAREPADDQRVPRVRLPGRGARVAGRDRARVPDRAGRGRAAQVRGSRPGGGGRGGRAGAAAALGGRDRRVAATGLLRRRGVPARRSTTASAASSTRSTRTRTSSARAARGRRSRTSRAGGSRDRRRARPRPCRRSRASARPRASRALVVITAGFAEAGAEGAARLARAAGRLPRERDAARRAELHGRRQHRPGRLASPATFARADVPRGHGRLRLAERARSGRRRSTARRAAGSASPRSCRWATRPTCRATTSCSTGSRTRRHRSSRCTWSPSATRASSAGSPGASRGPSRCWRSRRGGRRAGARAASSHTGALIAASDSPSTRCSPARA